jgi:hypothetical protein
MIRLPDLTARLRELHGAAHNVQAHEIVVLFLVDELLKVSPQPRSNLLNALCEGMQVDLKKGLPTMAAVSCLDVNSTAAA